MPARNQLWLLDWNNPIIDRIGAGFFRALPQCPGVYHFLGSEKQILYIGQSNNLKKRINSYKYIHPDTHPKRLVELVCKVNRIEYEKCESPMDAEILENKRISEFKPPFNRQKVFPEGYSFLSITIPFWNQETDELELRFEFLGSDQRGRDTPAMPLFGAFKSRYAVIRIIRCLKRLLLAGNQIPKKSHGYDYSKIQNQILFKKVRTKGPMVMTCPSFMELSCWELYKHLILYFFGESDHLVTLLLKRISLTKDDLEKLEMEDESSLEFWRRWLLEDLLKLDHFFNQTLRRHYLARKNLGIQFGYIEPMLLNDALTKIGWDNRNGLSKKSE